MKYWLRLPWRKILFIYDESLVWFFKCNTLFCIFPLFTQDEFSNNVHVCYKSLERSEAKETKILLYVTRTHIRRL